MLQTIMIPLEGTEQQKDAKIAQLTSRVKHLQRELADRVRGFLLQGRHKTARLPREQSTQTELDPSPSLQPSTAPFLHSEEKRQDLDLSYSPQQSEPDSDLSTPIKETSGDEPQFSTSGDAEKELQELRGREAALMKEGRRTRREIQRLREQVRFLEDLVTVTREGLLAAEEQNYQFRLQLQEMERKLDWAKEEELESQMKSMGLQLNRSQTDLKAIADALVGEQLPAESIVGQWKALTRQIYEVVSKLPVQGHCEVSLLFQPETLGEAELALKSVLEYAGSMEEREEKWEARLQSMRKSCNQLLREAGPKLGHELLQRVSTTMQVSSLSSEIRPC